MNEAILLKALLGKTHRASAEQLVATEYDRKSICLDCGQEITSYWNDDPDRLTGWTAWDSKADRKTCKADKK